MPFRLSPEADEDYIAIFRRGIEMFGREQAERYADGLDRLFEFLSDYPRAARERREIEPAVRAHPTKSHIIIYQIEDDDGIVILRIRHASEDWAVSPL